MRQISRKFEHQARLLGLMDGPFTDIYLRLTESFLHILSLGEDICMGPVSLKLIISKRQQESSIRCPCQLTVPLRSLNSCAFSARSSGFAYDAGV